MADQVREYVVTCHVNDSSGTFFEVTERAYSAEDAAKQVAIARAGGKTGARVYRVAPKAERHAALSAAERFALTRFRKAQDRGSEVDDYDYRAALGEILADLDAGLTEARADSVFGV